MSRIFTGETIPLICVPITAKNSEQFKKQLGQLIAVQPDVIEWRADFFSDLAKTSVVIQLIEYVKTQTDIPLLFTIRSEKEGGEKIPFSEGTKVDLIKSVCQQTTVDLIDYEVMNDRKYVNVIREVTAENQIELILSYHHFTKTPNNEKLIKIASLMEFYGADVAKIAVMPTSQHDVNRLLTLTGQLDELLRIPVITMSMGELGVLSRVIGWAYGSQLTFAVGVESSAPGQVPITKLRDAINAVHAITSSKN